MRSCWPAALHVRCVAYAVCHAACGACGAPTAPAPAAFRASRAAASRPLRARAASSLHALHSASGVRFAHLYNPRAPQRPRHAAAATHPPRVTSFAYDGARPKSSLRSKVARRGRRASWKRRRSSARPLRFSVVQALRVKAPPRPGSAKPRGAAPELGRHYAAAGRATSHNGVRYASVHPKPRPAKTRSASWGSHVALSGAPPRWNRSVLFPWRCPAAAAWWVVPATVGRSFAAALFSLPPLAARPPAGAGRVGRAGGAPRSALTARGSREARARAPCSPVVFVEGEPPASRPGALAGRFNPSTGSGFRRPASPFPR
jgi:hypothetical protein